MQHPSTGTPNHTGARVCTRVYTCTTPPRTWLYARDRGRHTNTLGLMGPPRPPHPVTHTPPGPYPQNLEARRSCPTSGSSPSAPLRWGAEMLETGGTFGGTVASSPAVTHSQDPPPPPRGRGTRLVSSPPRVPLPTRLLPVSRSTSGVAHQRTEFSTFSAYIPPSRLSPGAITPQWHPWGHRPL